MFHRAIVCRPSVNFADGLSSAGLASPDYARAVKQHDAYCAALERCGLILTQLEPDQRYPDSTFVEDTAVLIGQRIEDQVETTGQGRKVGTTGSAIIARPGATSRRGEITAVKEVLTRFYSELHSIREPGTVDGGDICQAGNHFFIGLSARTNEAGAQQLAEQLRLLGYTSSFVDIRERSAHESTPTVPASPAILHLKSGLAYLGKNHLVVIESLARREVFRDYELIRVDDGEEYAANCLRINDYLLVAAGYPTVESRLREQGYETITLDMTEFKKMDGGLSCLSLRF